MNIFFPLVFFCLIMGPILLVWLKGNQILDALVARREVGRKRRRRRSTRSLPVREEVLEALLKSEGRREGIEDRIGNALMSFRQVSGEVGASPHQDPDKDLEGLGQTILTRESHFNSYLDVAWLQSETIELLSQEVMLLRELAEVPRVWPASDTTAQFTAAERLSKSVERAVKKREQVDLMLDRIGGRRDQGAENH